VTSIKSGERTADLVAMPTDPIIIIIGASLWYWLFR